ncbi:MAG: type transport system permease protein [Tepidanaerobacteraceae bacterium]|nr:type transport system permease protein [Tepidanaerobacteraceae bacterium]
MVKEFFISFKNEWLMAKKEKMILIVLFAIPVMVNILLGYEMSQNQMKHIPMAVCDMDDSYLSRTIVQQFAENETFDVKYYLQDSLQMQEFFKKNMVRVGLLIPKGFEKDVTNLKSPALLMIYDGSSMPMASTAKTRASEILLTLKTGILIKQIQARLNIPEDEAEKMAMAVNFSNRTLYNPTRGYKNFLNLGLCAAAIQSGIGILAASSIRDGELSQKRIPRIGLVVGKIVFYGLMGGISLGMTLTMQNKFFDIPFRGKLWDAVILCGAFSFAAAALGVLISAFIRKQLLATVVAAVIYVPDTILAGYTWPVIAMPELYQKLAYFLPFYHFADNMRDLVLKGMPIEYMYGDIRWFAAFTAITAFASILGSMRLWCEKGRMQPVVESGGGQSAAL